MRFFGTFLSRKVPYLQRTCNEVVMATDIKIMLSYCMDRASAVAEQQDCPKTDAFRGKNGEAITDGRGRPSLRSRILLCIFSSEFFVRRRLRSLFSERKRNKSRLKQNPSVKITEGFLYALGYSKVCSRPLRAARYRVASAFADSTESSR